MIWGLVNVPLLNIWGGVYLFFHGLALMEGCSIRDWDCDRSLLGGVSVCLRGVWNVYVPPRWMMLLVWLGGIEGIEGIHCARHDSLLSLKTTKFSGSSL